MDTARIIIEVKVKRRRILLNKYNIKLKNTPFTQIESLEDLFLYEARNAKQFWRNFKCLLPNWSDFSNRKSHSKDATNKLLDIGYHHLSNEVKKILVKYNIPPEIGIMHVAKNNSDTPLVYDLMEMFRGDVVDEEVLHFLRLKKVTFNKVEPKDVSKFIVRIKKKLNRKYYLKDFKQCHTYRYYMELQILKFIKSVNHQVSFDPIDLPVRHDSRCSEKKT